MKNPAMFVRPRSQNPDMAFYAPERDFGIQGLRIIGEVENLLNGRLEECHADYVLLGGSEDLAAAWHEWNIAGKALAVFVADAKAADYTGPDVTEWTVSQRAVSFTEAMERLRSCQFPIAVQFLLSLVGRFALDAFFYGERSSLQVGQPMHADYNRYLDFLSVAMQRSWSPRPQSEYLQREFERVVSAMLAEGSTPASIEASLSKVYASANQE